MYLSSSRFTALGFLLLLGSASCSKTDEKAAPANRISFNDFESLDGWLPSTPSLTTAQAHSGRYSIKVDQDAEYSVGYYNLLGKTSASKIRKLTLHGWAYPSGPKAAASLVVQILNPNKNNEQVFYESLDLSKAAQKMKAWNEVHKEFTLPANIEAAHQLRVYMWRGGSQEPTYLDDLEILKGE